MRRGSPASGVLHLAAALARERGRYLAVRLAAATAFLAGLGAAHGWVGLTLGGAVPALTAQTVGTYCALITTSLFSLVGFFVARGNIERDRQSRVGELLAASPLTTTRYMLVQFVALLTLLCGLLLCVVVGAFGVPGALWQGGLVAVLGAQLPALLLAVPSLVFVAGLTVVLDSTTATSGAAGNAVFLVVWIAFLGGSFSGSGADLMGIGHVVASLQARARTLVPPLSSDVALLIDVPRSRRVYEWNGMAWTLALVAQRVFWVAGGLIAALMAVPIFEHAGQRATIRATPAAAPASAGQADSPREYVPATWLPRSSIMAAELRLLRRDLRWWHLLAFAASIFAGIAPRSKSPMDGVLPLAWLWPAGLLASIGAREFVSGVDQILITNARATAARVLGGWCVGIALMAACGGGVLVRVLLDGHSGLALAWVGGALFVPALALFLGELSRTRRLFEALYVLVTYFGPIRGNRALDFAGATAARGGEPRGAFFIGLAIVMVTAVVVRRIVRARG